MIENIHKNIKPELLKKYKLPFSIFVSSKYISDDRKTDFMSWEMLKEITNNKGLVLNHSKSHKSFLDLEINELQKEVIENQIIINLMMTVFHT